MKDILVVVKRDLVSDIISSFEDFLRRKGIKPEMIYNPERDANDEGENILYGNDCDNLEANIRVDLLRYGILMPDEYTELGADEIQSKISS